MKKKIGTLRGKPIVEGDSNLVKKTEIDISTIGNASTDDEYVYFFFPRDIFVYNQNEKTPIIVEEQTDKTQILLKLIAILCTYSSNYVTIRKFWSSEVRYNDKKLYSNNIFYIQDILFLKCSKNLEYTYTTGSYDNIVHCIRGNYKKIISYIFNGIYNGNELDPYLISKELWNELVEETYKNYREIIEL